MSSRFHEDDHATVVLARLSDADMERLADIVSEKMVKQMTHMIYAEVGKGVLKKLLFLVGAAAVGALLWAKEHHWMTGH